MQTQMKSIIFTALIAAIVMPLSSASAQIYLRKDAQQQTNENTQTPPTAVPAKKAEPITPEQQPSESALTYAQKVADACLGGQWEEQVCLEAVSQNNLVMASNYAAALSENGHAQSAENIKQNCAASTAATEGQYPAVAMRSAYVECVNTIVDVVGQTNIMPDQSQYQLIVSAVQCLDGAPSCAQIEQGLANYR